MFDDLTKWKTYTLANWQDLYKRTESLKLSSMYHRYVAMILLPVLPTSASDTHALIRLLNKTGVAGVLCVPLQKYARAVPFKAPTVTDLLSYIHQEHVANSPFFQGEAAASMAKESLFDLVITFLQEMTQPAPPPEKPSLSFTADSVNSKGDIIVAQGNVYKGDSGQQALKCYLNELRAQSNFLDFSSIFPDPIWYTQTRLYQLYAPLDVWKYSPLDKDHAAELTRLRHRAVELDLPEDRYTTVKAANDATHLVITGGPGTGKSTICDFLTVGLAYACDPEAEAQDGVKGLELLGPDWQHGALLPFYVRLRHFASDDEHFPRHLKDASPTNLLGYLKAQLPDFASQIAVYLNKPVPNNASSTGKINGALLILDGLDEIYESLNRRKAKKVIEAFCNSFPNCRVLVTCRSAAYHDQVSWRLDNRFTAAELAPYTWLQVSQYITNWYHSVAEHRPTSLGGRDVAHANAQKYIDNLNQVLKEHTHLWSLARQPLLLTLMVLIHEAENQLPLNRAELYEKTVNLLHKWNPPDEDDPLAAKLRKLDAGNVRQVMQLVAFNAQRDRTHYKDNEASIERPQLTEQLLKYNDEKHALGAAIDDVLEYLATRNGILVADSPNFYRFLHLSIREFLAACALIEQYDEIQMPSGMRRPSPGPWKFPDNICALLNKDPHRWREVALFCGAILGNDKGQERLWVFLDALLPDKPEDKKYSEGDIYRIAIAAEVWRGNQMRPRLRFHQGILLHLQKSTKAILNDERLDIPELIGLERTLFDINQAVKQSMSIR